MMCVTYLEIVGGGVYRLYGVYGDFVSNKPTVSRLKSTRNVELKNTVRCLPCAVFLNMMTLNSGVFEVITLAPRRLYKSILIKTISSCSTSHKFFKGFRSPLYFLCFNSGRNELNNLVFNDIVRSYKGLRN